MSSTRNGRLPPKIAQILGVTSDAREIIRSYDFSGVGLTVDLSELFVSITSKICADQHR